MGIVLDSRDFGETVRDLAQRLLEIGTPEARQQFDALMAAFELPRPRQPDEPSMPDASGSDL
jgi:hypothetical protein